MSQTLKKPVFLFGFSFDYYDHYLMIKQTSIQVYVMFLLFNSSMVFPIKELGFTMHFRNSVNFFIRILHFTEELLLKRF